MSTSTFNSLIRELGEAGYEVQIGLTPDGMSHVELRIPRDSPIFKYRDMNETWTHNAGEAHRFDDALFIALEALRNEADNQLGVAQHNAKHYELQAAKIGAVRDQLGDLLDRYDQRPKEEVERGS